MKLKDYFKEENYIHYSNCHEDADFALRNITNSPQNILTIASGLDNALAFLLLDPKRVLAIDSNPTQVYLCNLKKCGIKNLERQEFMVLLGIAPGDSLACYERIRPFLDTETRQYFDSHRFLISPVGLVNCGKFEYYFTLFKEKILTLTHSKKVLRDFMTASDLEKQQKLYKKFNNIRFRAVFNVFFSQAVMKRLGRDKEYFRYNKGSLTPILKRKLDECIKHNLNADNSYFQYVINNRFDALPAYLREGNYEKIRENIDKLTIEKVSFTDAVCSGESYDFIYLSDIFEYMSVEETKEISSYIYSALSEGGMAMLYNMMNPRRLSGDFAEKDLDQAQNCTFYYMKCYMYTKE